MKKQLLFVVLVLAATMAMAAVVGAQEVEFVETENGFDDAVVNCRLIGDFYQEEFDKFANGEYSTKGVQWQEFVYSIRYDATLYCGFVTSTVPSDKYAAFEKELSEAAFKYETAYELRLTAIEDGNNPAINELAARIHAEAEELYNLAGIVADDAIVVFK